MSQCIWVGIDASADAASICVINDCGEILRETVLPACARDISRELRPLKRRKKVVVGIEAGDVAINLVRGLQKARYDVRILETRATSKFARIRLNKTDRNDARGIAEVTRLGSETVPEVALKTLECQKLRSELVLRAQLMRQRIAIENVIRAVIRLNGGKVARCCSGSKLEESIRAELSRLRKDGNDIRELLGPALTTAMSLHQALDKITMRLTRLAREHEVCRRLMTIPGIGPMCALSFYTTIENPDRFKASDDVAPYLGLVPRVVQSGSSSRYGRITKAGNKMTRTFLYAATASLMQERTRDCPASRWALAVAERRGRQKARVALAKKLAIVMLGVWKSGDEFRSEGRGAARGNLG